MLRTVEVVQTCPSHPHVSYSDLEQCSECRSSASIVFTSKAPKADTAGLRVIAARYRLRELSCWDETSNQMREDGHVAVKWSAEAGKWAGRADELEARILEIEHDQWLVEQDRFLNGGGDN